MATRKPPTRKSASHRAGSSPTKATAGRPTVNREAEFQRLQSAYGQVFSKLLKMRRDVRAKFDAAQTFTANENHWENADHLDPHAAASASVRRNLRSRSRYEVIENNPYLKGTLLTISNDFIGSGPKLQVTDKRLTKSRRQIIEEKFMDWCAVTGIRQKIWRMRMAKFTDGESFMIPYANKNRRLKYPLELDFHVIETDRISSESLWSTPSKVYGEIDGVRFDSYENPLAYHVLYQHPGGSALNIFNPDSAHNGKWINAKYVIHWFRQDRGWLRGIPEITPSLPLCALLRRYTLSIVRHAEVLADFTILLETDNPGSPNPLDKDTFGNLSDDPFDIWPIEMGMMSNLPYGYKAHQMESVPLGTQYDAFVGALLREIMRPILAPFNIASGTSKDSNMASGVLDQHIYTGGQTAERISCHESVLCWIFYFWWNEAIRTPGYLGDNFLASDRTFQEQPPKYRFRWDRVSIDHTDPQKCAEALKVLHDKRFLTDADIQEGYYNRDVETWRDEIREDQKFRDELEPVNPEDRPPPVAPEPGGSKAGKKPAKKKKATASDDEYTESDVSVSL